MCDVKFKYFSGHPTVYYRPYILNGHHVPSFALLYISSVESSSDIKPKGNWVRYGKQKVTLNETRLPAKYIPANSGFSSKSGNIVAILRLFKKNKKGLRINKTKQVIDIIMVPELGIEPRCPCERGILSPN